MYEFVLLRHGEAELAAGRDSDRRLTERGRREVLRVAARIGERMRVARVAASPLSRAHETAHLLRDAIAAGTTVETWVAAAPEGNPDDVIDELLQADQAGLVVVTHQPLIANLVIALTGHSIGIATATAIAIASPDLARHAGAIQWVVDGAP